MPIQPWGVPVRTRIVRPRALFRLLTTRESNDQDSTLRELSIHSVSAESRHADCRTRYKAYGEDVNREEDLRVTPLSQVLGCSTSEGAQIIPDGDLPKIVRGPRSIPVI